MSSSDAPRSASDALDLFVISFGLLFLEQACIRWLPSHFRILTYFSNFVLLGCFLGMGVGLLRAARPSLLWSTLPLLLLATVILKSMNLTVQIEPASGSQAIYFGADVISQHGPTAPLLVVLTLSFLLVTAMFVGPGQGMGALFDRLPPLYAYSVNIGGSLLGIATFMGMSALSLPPAAWFLLGGCTVLWLLRANWRQLALSSLALVAATAIVADMERGAIWSPYNRLEVAQRTVRGITFNALLVNGLTHQEFMRNSTPGAQYYYLPYILSRQSGHQTSPGSVLVIGAGTGNDLSHALEMGASHIDAVEIDPRIQRLGRELHPEHPYADSRVHVTIDDGRSFLRNHTEQYDWVVYAVVDSLTLLSQFGAVRLENYLFTRDAVQDVKSHLKPHGIFAAYNFYRKAWLAVRIHHLLTDVFGADHVVMLTLPPRDKVSEEDGGVNMVLFMAGDVAEVRKLLESRQMILQISPWEGSEKPSEPTQARTLPLFPVRQVAGSVPLTTDDWPFPYLRDAVIPIHNLEAIALILVLSAMLLLGPAGARSAGPSPHFFLLGCAFMLIETQGIARLCLLFGSTWVTNSLTFLGILTFILLANLVTARVPNVSYRRLYLGLLIGLGVEYAVPLSVLLTQAPLVRALGGLVLLFLPVFFAGCIFARSFHQSHVPHRDLGWNLFGAVVGGCLESTSCLFGYHALILLTALVYAASWGVLKDPHALVPNNIDRAASD